MAGDLTGRKGDFLDAAQLAPLVQGLRDPVPEVRIAVFESLTRLPLPPDVWREVITYGMGALTTPRTPDERLTVLGALPALPTSRLHARVAELTRDADELVRNQAGKAMSRIAASRANPDPQVDESPLRPTWAGGEPPGFAFDVDLDQARATVDGILAADEPGGESDFSFDRVRRASRTRALPMAPAAVTLFFDYATQTSDVILGNETVRWVREIQGFFLPDIEGLFAIYRREAAALLLEWPDLFPYFFASGLDLSRRWLCWQLGWTVSRGGLRWLVAALTEHLRATDAEERMTAALLIADAADYSIEPEAPTFGGGSGPERRMNASVIIEGEISGTVTGKFSEAVGIGRAARAEPEPALDEDVQFSAYRPSIVRPQRWYPLLVFVHRTTVFKDADGRMVDPVASVERQAAALLADQPAPFKPVRTDSPPLRRGTELHVQPWLEESEVNPPWAPIRWEEPIHRVEFRIKAPASADGRFLRGGVRVFRSGLLIGEIGFYVSVSASASVEVPTADRLAMKRYRKVFASFPIETQMWFSSSPTTWS